MLTFIQVYTVPSISHIRHALCKKYLCIFRNDTNQYVNITCKSAFWTCERRCAETVLELDWEYMEADICTTSVVRKVITYHRIIIAHHLHPSIKHNVLPYAASFLNVVTFSFLYNWLSLRQIAMPNRFLGKRINTLVNIGWIKDLLL